MLEEIVVGRDEEDLKKYGKTGTISIGRHLVGTGEDAHLTTPVLLDVLRPHILTIMGKRGSGKSWTFGVLMEEMSKLPEDVRNNLCVVVIDPQGIFWTIKSPNEKEADILDAWKMKPRGFDIDVYVPEGQTRTFTQAGVDFDAEFSFSPDELTIDDWITLFSLNINEPLGILLQKSFSALPEGSYTIDDLIFAVNKQEGFETEKLALENKFYAAKTWGIFGESRMPPLLEPGKISILDVSLTSRNVRSLLLALISRRIFQERTRARRKEELSQIEASEIERVPMCWILIDDAQNFVPENEILPSSEIISRIIREGRQPGISLALATQNPQKLSKEAISQCDMIISHRLTSKEDIEALKATMQTYMMYDITKYINELPKVKGTAIIMDDNSERIYKIRIRPRQSWHAGASPTVI